MKAVHRQWFERNGDKQPWRDSYTLESQSVDHIMPNNVAGYSDWIDERSGSQSTGKEVVSMTE